MSDRLNLRYLQGMCDDERPLAVEIKADDGTVTTGNVWSIAFEEDKIVFHAVMPKLVKEKRPVPTEGRRVKPLPSSPYVGPNGEFYPVGGEPIH